MKRFLLGFFSCIIPFVGMGDVLLWMVDWESSVYAFLSPVPEDDLHSPAARVKISGGGLTSPIYLDNHWQDEDASAWELDLEVFIVTKL